MSRVLYSFPNKIGAQRICRTAWEQVAGAAVAGSELTVLCGSYARDFLPNIKRYTTLCLGPVRIPYKVIGRDRALRFHDWQTAIWLKKNAEKIDVVHLWPASSLRTIRMAKMLGIPTLLERPNAHTRYAYKAAAEENNRVGMVLPEGHDHAFNDQILKLEEQEYDEADYILCPSEFVAKTFNDHGFEDEKLLKHQYGFDEERFVPGEQKGEAKGLQVLYVGSCEPRKGLHYILKAWLASSASEEGKLRVCGSFVPKYAEILGDDLNHPSVEVLGHRDDVDELMRQSDVFTLSSIEEGSALVTYEARGAGCVLLVSDATGAMCENGVNALVHTMRSVETLRAHFDLVDQDRNKLRNLRESSLSGRSGLSWKAAGKRLHEIYQGISALRK